MARPDKALISQSFFKTKPGQYGYGDRFIGVTIPVLRKIVKSCQKPDEPSLRRLLKSPIHEERLLALLLMVKEYERGSPAERAHLFHLYLNQRRYVNNWDLVDLSAPKIIGAHLAQRSRTILYRLARAPSLWDRRIAIVATYQFIRCHEYQDTLTIAALLLRDREDLIHKAVGWMLREVGKRSRSSEERFLAQHAAQMPRTMLRYAIERFPETLRLNYLRGSTVHHKLRL